MNNNGRIDLINLNENNNFEDMQNSCFTHSDRIPAKETLSYREALTGNLLNSKLSDLYFSKENIKLLQNGLRAGVYNKSKGAYLIDEQSEDELKIIMRSTFLQYSNNDLDNIKEQITELNDLILEYAVNQVYNEAQSYIQYKIDASTLIVPMASPVMEIKDDKQLKYQDRF